jgi:hypothetical protein
MKPRERNQGSPDRLPRLFSRRAGRNSQRRKQVAISQHRSVPPLSAAPGKATRTLSLRPDGLQPTCNFRARNGSARSPPATPGSRPGCRPRQIHLSTSESFSWVPPRPGGPEQEQVDTVVKRSPTLDVATGDAASSQAGRGSMRRQEWATVLLKIRCVATDLVALGLAPARSFSAGSRC